MKDFSELRVREEALAVLRRCGIRTATPVQEAAIPLVRKGADVIVKAPTGTGKTLAFLLPLMERLKPHVDETQALILTPTRELTIQIARTARALAPAFSLRTLAVYGGRDIERQKERLRRSPQLIVGTPGRLLDHLRRRTLRIEHANRAVLDEADEMMKRGFLEDVETLLETLAPDRQLLLFSATMPRDVRALAHRYMRKPEAVTIEAEGVVLDAIAQEVVDTTEETKPELLARLIEEKQPYLMMVFCMTRQRVQQVAAALARRGCLADELHGELTQAQRASVLRRFREAELQVLVTTDIAARGLDIEGVTHVVNYDIPRTAEDYIHRVGRTGRAGRTGEAVTFVNARQYDQLRRIKAGIRSRLKSPRPQGSRGRADAGGDARQARAGAKRGAAKSLRRGAHPKGAAHGGRNPRGQRAAKGEGRGRRGR